jgi:hypothetical protein
VRSKGRHQPVDHVLGIKINPETQKPQRDGRGFYKFRWWPGAESTGAEDVDPYRKLCRGSIDWVMLR